MAIAIRPAAPLSSPEQAAPAVETIKIDATIRNDPRVIVAQRLADLDAARSGHKAAHRLAAGGLWLLLGVIAVSFVHLWETLALFLPATVDALHLPASVYHATTAALTLAIDATAAYLAMARAMTPDRGRAAPMARWFFYALTAMLNAAFFLRYAPDLSEATKAAWLAPIQTAMIVLLAVMIPVSIGAIEAARGRLAALARTLRVETVMLEILSADGGRKTGHSASASRKTQTAPERPAVADATIDADPITGRTPTRYSLDNLLAVLEDGQPATRKAIIDRLEASPKTADRLLAAGIDAGAVAQIERGVYQRV